MKARDPALAVAGDRRNEDQLHPDLQLHGVPRERIHGIKARTDIEGPSQPSAGLRPSERVARDIEPRLPLWKGGCEDRYQQQHLLYRVVSARRLMRPGCDRRRQCAERQRWFCMVARGIATVWFQLFMTLRDALFKPGVTADLMRTFSNLRIPQR